MFSFYINTFFGELLGTLVVAFIMLVVYAYAASKTNSKNIFLALGFAFAQIIGGYVAIFIERTSNNIDPNAIGAVNPGLQLGYLMSQGFTESSNWGFFPLVVIAQLLGGIIGAIGGQYFIKLLFRKDELAEAFKTPEYQRKGRYLLMDYVAGAIFFIAGIAIMSVGSSGGVSVNVFLLGLIVLLLVLTIGQKFNININIAAFFGILLTSRMTYGKAVVKSIGRRVSTVVIANSLAAASIGTIFGLVALAV